MSVLSRKEVQRLSAGAAMEASSCEEPRHFVMFLSHGPPFRRSSPDSL